jgi:hypothetical protein
MSVKVCAVSKDTKAQAQYTPVAMKPWERCGVCKYYIRLNARNGDCEKVTGTVAERGWCKHWAKE